MKAFVLDRYSKKGDLRLAELPTPELRDDEVLVQVHAAGVNLLDSKIRSGEFKLSKSAAWSLTNALRNELLTQKTQVLGLHMAYVDTDLTRGFDVPKSSPEKIVQRALDGLEAGQTEVLADELTMLVKNGMTAPTPTYLHPLG